MRRYAGALVWAAFVFVAPSARAYDNDLELHRLGSPSPLVAGGQAVEADPLAQERFARFASEFALAVTPMPADLNASVGDAGFSIAFTPQVAFIHPTQRFSDGLGHDVWPTEAPKTGDSASLFLPTLHLRKGLPFSLEVGTDITYVAFSTMMGVSGSVKWTLVEGFQWFPDLAVRAFGGTVLGTGQLSIVTGGWDAGLSYRFPLAGGAEAGLYGGFQMMGLNASSGNIDFQPREEDPGDPSTDDTVFTSLPFGSIFSPTTGFKRMYFGAQVRTGVLVVGVDVSSAWGTVAVDADTKFDAGLVKMAGRVGVTF